MVELNGRLVSWLVVAAVALWVVRGVLGLLTGLPLAAQALQVLGLVYAVRLLLDHPRAGSSLKERVRAFHA
jgi:hypothetical protein